MKNIMELSDEQRETLDELCDGHTYFVNVKTKTLMFDTGDEQMTWEVYRTDILGKAPIKDKNPAFAPEQGKENYYITKKEMLYEILKSKQAGELTPRAQEMFILLGKRIMKRLQRRYKSKEDMDDCMQTGLLHLFKSWDKFKPSKSNNPFAYYTEIFKKGAADGHNTLYRKKGDNENEVHVVSYTSANEGSGMFNIN